MPNSVYSSTRGYSSRAARQTGRLDRAAEKSIIDPLRFRVAFYATLYAIPRLRIFGRVRVIRRHTRDSSSRPRPTVEKKKERWNGSRATGKTMPRCCITFNELSFRFLKNERFTVWSGRKSEIPHYAIPNFGTFFGLEQEERCEPDMEIRRSMNSDELNVRRGRVERIDIEKIEIEKRIGKLEG